MSNPKKILLVSIFAVALIAGIIIWQPAAVETVTESAYFLSSKTIARVKNYDAYVAAAAAAHNIPPQRIKAHIAVESGGDPDALGAAGDTGLMQITQIALDDINSNFSAGFAMSDMTDPRNNIYAGTAYLHLLYNRLGSLDLSSAAYNAGSAAAKKPTALAELYLGKVKKAETYFT